MNANLRTYEMVEGTTTEEAALMKQQRRIEEAQRLRRQMRIAGRNGEQAEDAADAR